MYFGQNILWAKSPMDKMPSETKHPQDITLSSGTKCPETKYPKKINQKWSIFVVYRYGITYQNINK